VASQNSRRRASSRIKSWLLVGCYLLLFPFSFPSFFYDDDVFICCCRRCPHSHDQCQSKDQIELRLEVVSSKPRVFVIENFLNEFEANHVIALAKVGEKDSVVSSEGRRSEIRTSSNSWVYRESDALIDSLHKRAGDVLQVDERLLHAHAACEPLQVVHYETGEKYGEHHDWFPEDYVETRMITMLLYLTDQASPNAGGETSFPKGGVDGLGFKVKPKRGTAVLFYNLLEDGNLDDLALHAALPVLEGEKWLANFWVWDPQRKR